MAPLGPSPACVASQTSEPPLGACAPPQSELRSDGLKKIGVHNLSPGMVTTDLLMAGTNSKVAK